ncbi:hypothetical protein [Brevundimonas vesicularis]|uniref:hypothetical protein n=1 Tax=Brevundimonas vesicularis TaxID=41276 RepID=UPI0038D38B82
MTTLPSSGTSAQAEGPRLAIAPLTEADATAEYALAQLWRPNLSPTQWQVFLRQWHAQPGQRGIISARSQRGGVLGFVPWWQQPDLEFGQVLWAGPFVVRELGVRPLVRQALTKGLVQRANQTGLNLRLAEAG